MWRRCACAAYSTHAFPSCCSTLRTASMRSPPFVSPLLSEAICWGVCGKDGLGAAGAGAAMGATSDVRDGTKDPIEMRAGDFSAAAPPPVGAPAVAASPSPPLPPPLPSPLPPPAPTPAALLPPALTTEPMLLAASIAALLRPSTTHRPRSISRSRPVESSITFSILRCRWNRRENSRKTQDGEQWETSGWYAL